MRVDLALLAGGLVLLAAGGVMPDQLLAAAGVACITLGLAVEYRRAGGTAR